MYPSDVILLQNGDCNHIEDSMRKPRITRNQRQAANARERARMMVLSKAFNKLKSKLPWVPPDTKLSKLDTLNLAANYIAHLTKLLECSYDQEVSEKCVSMVWPNSKFRCRTSGTCQIDEKCDCLERKVFKSNLTSTRKRCYVEDNNSYELTDYSNLEMD